MINGKIKKVTNKFLLIMISMCLCLCIGVAAFANTKSLNSYAEGLVPNMDFTWENGLSQKLDAYGTRYSAKRGQTYGSDTILNNADGSITNALLAGNGNVGLVKGGTSSGQSIKIGMNSYWKGTYNPDTVDGIFPQSVGSIGYDVVSETNTANIDLDLATTYKNVTASNSESGFPASAAVSGDYVSTAFWGMGWWTERGKGKGSWLQLEFAEPISFNRYVLWNDGACRYDADLNVENGGTINAWDKANTNAWKIQVSDTGVDGSWKDVDTELDNLLPVYDKDLKATATGKFVRLYITKSVVSGTETAKVCKFSLFAEPKNDKNLMPKAMNGRKNAKIEVSSTIVPDAGQDAPHIYAASNVYATVTGRPLHLSSYGSSGSGWFTDTTPQGDEIIYTLNEPTTFKSYQLFNGSASSVNSYLRADWTAWEVYVSKNGGASYNKVHEVLKSSNKELEGGQPAINSFNIPADQIENTKGATNIKLKITGVPPYASRTLLSQFKIYAGTLDESGIDQTNTATFTQNIKEGKVGAECSYDGNTYETSTTISQNGDNYVVTKFKNTSNKPITMRFYTTAHHYRNPEYTQTAAADKNFLTATRTTETTAEKNLAWVSAATIAAKVEGGEWTNFGSTATSSYGEFVIPANSEKNVVTYIDGMQYTKDVYADYANITAKNSPSKEKAIAKLNANVKADTVFTETAAYWKEYWLKSYIDIYDKTVEEYYYNSFYIVGSATRVGAAPSSLFGPYMTSDTLAWGGTYVTDYNLYGTYMAVAAANREELLKPLVVNALESWGGDSRIKGGIGQDYAEKFNAATNSNFRNADGSLMFKNGVDGVLSSVVAGPHGYAVNMPGFYRILFTSAYAAIPVLSYYDMTQGTGEVVEGVTLDADLEYKYLKDIMSLWEQILIYENGVYKVKYDAAWENEPNNMGNAFTIACMHMFTQRLVERAGELNITEEQEPRLLKWKHIDANMEAYPIAKVTKKGVTRDCYADTLSSANKSRVTYNGKQDGGSNPNVVVAQVIPTDQLGLYSDPKQKEIMRNSIYTIESWSNINAMPTFFSTAARVGYGSDKYGNNNSATDKFDNGVSTILEQFNKVAASGLRFNNVSKLVDPLQLIDTCGGAQGVNDVLVQSFKDIITFFPAYETNQAGRFVDLQVKGGYLVSAEQNTSGEITFAKVKSQYGGTISLAMPAGANWNIVNSKGELVNVTRSNVGAMVGFDAYKGINTVTINTVQGESYYVVINKVASLNTVSSAQETACLPGKED